jgi:vancomycin aglycone glucosyltransferase
VCAPPDEDFAQRLAGVGVMPAAAGARSVAELGIGAAHAGPTPTTEFLSAALKTTLTPERLSGYL